MEKELLKYIEAFSSEEPGLLKELDRETNLKVVQPQMLSGVVQGKFLELLTKVLSPQRILEIGTFTGYSTLCFAAGLSEGGVIDTIEVNDELQGISGKYFHKSVHCSKIRQHIGSALEIAPGLEKVYDLVFIDGDKREYPDYYKMLLGDEPFSKPLVKPGSVILADNILWYGKVVGEHPPGDRHTQSILRFNEMVRSDPRVENVIMPVRDGINFIRVK